MGAKPRKPSEPSIWIASLMVIQRETGERFTGIFVSTWAHVSRKAGLNDLQDRIDKTFSPEKYAVELLLVTSIKWSQLLTQFNDFLNPDDDDDPDDDDPGDSRPLEPGPEDHGVPVPPAFADFIGRLAAV